MSEIRLMRRRELTSLFPDAILEEERIGPFVKSFVAVRGEDAVRIAGGAIGMNAPAARRGDQLHARRDKHPFRVEASTGASLELGQHAGDQLVTFARGVALARILRPSDVGAFVVALAASLPADLPGPCRCRSYLCVCEGGPLGSVGLPEDATDRGPEPGERPLSIEVVAALVGLVAELTGERGGGAMIAASPITAAEAVGAPCAHMSWPAGWPGCLSATSRSYSGSTTRSTACATPGARTILGSPVDLG